MEEGTDSRPVVRGEIVKLDYATLRETIYRGCKLVFEGGKPPIMENCDFVGCEFIFDGPAGNTQAFLRMLVGAGGASLVVNDMLGLKDWAARGG